MPSPFPGMDPYLENAATWPGIHQGLISLTWIQLSTVLPPPYVANMGERLRVVQTGRELTPDVFVKRPRLRRRRTDPATRTTLATQTDAASDEPVLLPVEPIELREAFIEIRLPGDTGHLVTVIEILSPSNKASGSPDRERYLTKQRQLLQSGIHLLEIDLLRRGLHTVAAPFEQLETQAEWDYVISLQRGGHNQCAAWPILLRQQLPRVRVPLAGRDPDVHVNLQDILHRCYDTGRYDLQIDYDRDPDAPLGKADAEWADALLREAGVRKKRKLRGRNGR